MGAVKKITIISIISAAVLGVFKKFPMEKRCFGIKVKRKHFWKTKKKSIGLFFEYLLKLFKAKRETRCRWKKMLQSAW